jgi:aryl-alcohol dehydrogenase-like predicted oxidoreductase
MQQTTLGNLAVSDQGLGCMGMSEFYGPSDWDTSIATVQHALAIGVTFFDTASMYGEGHNEVLLGRGVTGCRDEVQIATKFGIDRSAGESARRLRGARGYVKHSADTSLLRLGVDVIDLYYMHRPPQDAEIEETVGAMAELVYEGKVRHLGLSEVNEEQLRRAHAVHPISAVQSEYSLWTRDVEAVTPAMAELGIGLVPYSPLGRGFLTGAFDKDTLATNDMRRANARFADGALAANMEIAATVRGLAEVAGITPAQLALAWVYNQSTRLGVSIVPIPGTRNKGRLAENVAAVDVVLGDEVLEPLATLADNVAGHRAYAPPR